MGFDTFTASTQVQSLFWEQISHQATARHGHKGEKGKKKKAIEFSRGQRKAQSLREPGAGIQDPARRVGAGVGWGGQGIFMVGWCLPFKSLKTEGEWPRQEERRGHSKQLGEWPRSKGAMNKRSLIAHPTHSPPPENLSEAQI